MEKKIEEAIQQAKKGLKEIDSRVQAENRRLGGLGSREGYWALLVEKIEADNLIQVLQSRQRSEAMKEMSAEANPLLEELRQIQNRQMAICLKLAGLLKAAEGIRTNYRLQVRDDEVKVLVTDEPWRMALSEKREEVTYSTKVSMGDVKLEKIVEVHPGKPIYDSLPYSLALRREGEGKCKITEVGEPHFTELIKEDIEPSIFSDVRNIDLGEPIRKEGKLTSEAESLLKKSHSPALQISPASFTQFIKGKKS